MLLDSMRRSFKTTSSPSGRLQSSGAPPGGTQRIAVIGAGVVGLTTAVRYDLELGCVCVCVLL